MVQKKRSSQDRSSSRRQVLIVEDDHHVGAVMARAFDDDYEVLHAADGRAGLDLARQAAPDVIITDQRMPELSGVELLTQLKDELPRTVRILVTGYSDYDSVVGAVNEAHVDFYFEKPANPLKLRQVVETFLRNAELEREREELLVRLEHSVRQLEVSNSLLKDKEAELTVKVAERTRDLTESNLELQAANRKLREMAIRDSLTQLFNHNSLLEQIKLEAARSKRYGRNFCLLFIDLDDFKQVNDSYGHSTGDAVLCGIAELFRSQLDGLRNSDIAARYGGEEFCIILPETPLAGGRVKAERIRQAVEEANWRDIADPLERPVTISVGVAAFPEHGDSVSQLLDVADAALYEAKRGGKNRVAMGEVGRAPVYAGARSRHLKN